MKITQQHLFISPTSPAAGRLLIAEPFLNELYFQRAVILLIHHNQEESMGLVLNHPSETFTNEVLDDCELRLHIYHGGPVDTQKLFYVHTFGGVRGAQLITPNLYFGGDWTELMSLLSLQRHPERHARFFSGYAGWGPEQLNDELSEHAWVCIANFDQNNLLSRPSDHLWHDALSSQGPKLATFAHFPLNISDN